MDLDVLPTPIDIHTTPKELRELADRLEQKWYRTQTGQDVPHEVIEGKRAVLQFKVDQEKMPPIICIRPQDLIVGDNILIADKKYHVVATAYNEADQQWMVAYEHATVPKRFDPETILRVERVR